MCAKSFESASGISGEAQTGRENGSKRESSELSIIMFPFSHFFHWLLGFSCLLC